MLLILHLAFIGLALTGSARGQRCLTIPTSGGTPYPRPCVFPFTFKGRRYYSCTRDRDPKNQLWCSVSTDSNGNHVSGTGGWGHCGQDCFQASQTTNKPTSRRPVAIISQRPTIGGTLGKTSKLECVTISGVVVGKPCVLPFTFGGIKYEKCVPERGQPNISWCSTKVDATGTHVKGNWGHCSCRTNQEPTTARPSTRPSIVVTEAAFEEDDPEYEDQEDSTNDGRPQVVSDIQQTCQEPTFSELKSAAIDGSFLPEMTNTNFRCGVSRLSNINANFIIGGKASKLQEFPFAAMIGVIKANGQVKFYCGGSLINRRYVLSAAHCFGKTDVKATRVRLGEYDVTKPCDCLDGKCAPLPQTVGVLEIRIHESFDRNLLVNDIALVRLAAPAKLNPGVGVVCLPGLSGSSAINHNLNGKVATVIGWGRTRYASEGDLHTIGASTPIIQKVEVPIVSREACKRTYWRYTIDERHICAGDFNADSCKGDSGGPLLYRSNPVEPWTLIGIVSFGDYKCGNGDPGVNTYVEPFIGWIKQNIKA